MAVAALGLVLAGYLAGLGLELTAPAAPPQAAQLTAWLESHPIGTGLSGYWEANVVTMTSGGRVAVRPVTITDGRIVPAVGQVRDDWFNPARSRVDFVVLFPGVPGVPGSRLPRVHRPAGGARHLRQTQPRLPRRAVHDPLVAQEPAARHGLGRRHGAARRFALLAVI